MGELVALLYLGQSCDRRINRVSCLNIALPGGEPFEHNFIDLSNLMQFKDIYQQYCTRRWRKLQR